jgi:hypothetical protein
MINQNYSYKRVLIISGLNLSDDSATDITMRSYFEQWPKDKLLILTLTPTDKPFAKTVFIQSKLIERLRILARNIFLKKSKGIDNRNIVPGAIINEGNNRLSVKHRIFAIGTAYADMMNFKFPKDIIKVIDDFNPEVIYTPMGGIRLIKLANQYSERYKISIVPHFMDDWVSTIYTGSKLLLLPRRSLLRSLNTLLKKTKVCLGISQKMCNEYERMFNKNFLPLMNTINLKDFQTDHKESRNRSLGLVFTFFGGLHVNRWKSLLMFSEVLDTLTKNMGINLILEIYTSQDNIKKYMSKFECNNVLFHEFIDHKSACLKMLNTDYLVHVESFDDLVIQFTRLSISTKIPEYLASGTPIIGIGPSNIASIEYLKGNDCGYIITRLDYHEMQAMIKSAISGENNNSFSRNNLRLAETNHSSSQLELLSNLLSN